MIELRRSRGVVVCRRAGVRSRSAAPMLQAKGFETYDLGRMSA